MAGAKGKSFDFGRSRSLENVNVYANMACITSFF